VLRAAELAGTMADTSPEWKKPADIMKLHRRKSLGTHVSATRTTALSSARLSLDHSPRGRKAQKRKNPFACLPSTQVTKDSDENTETGDSIGGALVEVNRSEAASCFIDVLVCCFAAICLLTAALSLLLFSVLYILFSLLHIFSLYIMSLQCVDTVGWAAGRASGL